MQKTISFLLFNFSFCVVFFSFVTAKAILLTNSTLFQVYLSVCQHLLLDALILFLGTVYLLNTTMVLLRTTLILLQCCNIVLNYRILIYAPQIAHSHVLFMGKIADTLVEAGHSVVNFYFSSFSKNEILTERKLKAVKNLFSKIESHNSFFFSFLQTKYPFL